MDGWVDEWVEKVGDWDGLHHFYKCVSKVEGGEGKRRGRKEGKEK
jgi:hypothetical protein